MIYLIKSGDLWREAPGQGYTRDITKAGRYDKAAVVDEPWFKRGLTIHPITEVVGLLAERRRVLMGELRSINLLLQDVADARHAERRPGGVL